MKRTFFKSKYISVIIFPFISIIGIILLSGMSHGQSSEAKPTTKPTNKSISFNEQSRSDLKRRIKSFEPLKSFLVTKKGKVIFEHYADGFSLTSRVNIKSASKSILSALVGIALEEGHLKSLNQEVGKFFPNILENESVEKRQITIRDLLLMRSGLERTSFENYGAWVTSDNWLEYALQQPIVDTPGTVTNYSTGNSHILAALLSRVTDQDLRDYAQDQLFNPIGIQIQAWQKSPEGYRFGGNNFALTPEGFLRFGQLYLNKGKWEGKKVVPEKWVTRSTQSYVHDTYHGYPYGYYWWNAKYHGYEVDFAWGHGGQYLFILPDLNLVVVTTSNLQSVNDDDGYTEKIHEVLKESIIPAVR